MATCNDCLCHDACEVFTDGGNWEQSWIKYGRDGLCEQFKDRARFLEMPPVKIGDFAWVIRNYKGVPHAQTGKVTDMYFTREMKLHIVVSHIARGAWGEAVFATQEEAEKAIAEKKSKK